MSPKSNFSLDSFRQLDLPNLLINIWSYSDPDHADCSICKQYKIWCITAAKEQWCDFFYDFHKVLTNLTTQNKKWHDFDKISSADRTIIYSFLKRKWYDDDGNNI